jgi:hypothetical protein
VRATARLRANDTRGFASSPKRFAPRPAPNQKAGAVSEVVDELQYDTAVVEVLRNGSRRLKAGTVDAILDWILEKKYDDEKVVRAFLLCYRVVISPKVFWDQLVARFPFKPAEESIEAEAVCQEARKAIIDFIIFWLEECSTEDFFSVEGKMAPPLWKSTQEFLKKLQIHKYKEFAAALVEKIQKMSLPLQQLQERYKRELDQEESEVEARRTLFEDNSSMLWNFGAGVYSYFTAAELSERNLAEGHFGFLEITPEEICSCLTVTDFHQFRRININEFLLRLWEKDKLRSKIAEITQRFERTAYWVASEILSATDIQIRRAILEKFILAAEQCFLLNNFNGTMAMLAGLNNGAVTRLKHTWAELNYRTKGIFDKMDLLMTPLNNFKVYREHLTGVRQSQKACFPYMALILRDITFAHENPSEVSVAGLPPLVNFQKIDVLGKQLLDVKYHQSIPFQNLTEVPEPIQAFFSELKIITKEEELYKLSLTAEPREAAAS